MPPIVLIFLVIWVIQLVAKSNKKNGEKNGRQRRGSGGAQGTAGRGGRVAAHPHQRPKDISGWLDADTQADLKKMFGVASGQPWMQMLGLDTEPSEIPYAREQAPAQPAKPPEKVVPEGDCADEAHGHAEVRPRVAETLQPRFRDGLGWAEGEGGTEGAPGRAIAVAITKPAGRAVSGKMPGHRNPVVQGIIWSEILRRPAPGLPRRRSL